jgi:thiol-disulfide isomerase/thioredoxin
MKRRRLLALTPALAALAAAAPRAGAAPAAAGEAVRWPAVTLLDGERWAAPAGHAAVVVFWSTTCPYCRRHNAHVQKLYEAAGGKRLAVLGVARDRDAAAVRRHLAAHGWTFPVTMAQAPLAAALSTRNMIPLTVTVDRDGRLKQVIPGEMFEDDVLELLRLAA